MSDRTNRADLASSDELDSRLKRVDEVRWLATRYAPAAERRRLVALYLLNHELARAARVSEPMLASIRLQWWREALTDLGDTRAVKRHEVLYELAEAFSARGEMHGDFGLLVDHWEERVASGMVADDLDDAVLTELAVETLSATAFGDPRAMRGAVSRQEGGPERHLNAFDQNVWPALVHRAAIDREGRATSGLRARWRILCAMLTGRIG